MSAASGFVGSAGGRRRPFFTIGHSTRSVAELIALLREAGADLIADVRAFPRSRTNPQFNGPALQKDLEEAAMSYRYLPALGGRRHGREGS